MLVTTDRGDGPPSARPLARPPRTRLWIGEAYVAAVHRAGASALLVPPGAPDLDGLLALADAVLITGGAFDIHPRHYGETPTGRIDRVEEDRTDTELGLARACLRDGIPVLGVCGGMQALAVAAGGTLIQDLPPADAAHLAHEQPTDPATAWHRIRVVPPASQWLGEQVEANSTHHQAVREPGALVAAGWSDDGVIEVVAHPTHPFALGVQWHPELLGDLRPYDALVAAARARRA